jgi:phage major head subunit gpT-like protein
LTTGALTNDNYRTACTLLRKMKNSRGRELKLRCSHLICSEDNEWVAREILTQTRLASGEDNVAARTAQLLVFDGIGTQWAVADLTKNVKPYIMQNRRGITFQAVTDADSPQVFHRRRYEYGADWRGNVGNAYYQMIVASTGS